MSSVLSQADLPSVNFWDITVGDVNDDGFADLVLTFRGNVVPAVQSGVQVLIGDGAAGFAPLGGGDVGISDLPNLLANWS